MLTDYIILLETATQITEMMKKKGFGVVFKL